MTAWNPDGDTSRVLLKQTGSLSREAAVEGVEGLMDMHLDPPPTVFSEEELRPVPYHEYDRPYEDARMR